MGQRKAFCTQRIPESSCVRKETVDVDILVTPMNGDRKIMQSTRITSRPPIEKTRLLSISQGLKRSSKRRTNSLAYPFL